MRKAVIGVATGVVTAVAASTGVASASDPAVPDEVASAIEQASKGPAVKRFAPPADVRSWSDQRAGRQRPKRYDIDRTLYRGSFLLWMSDHVNVRGRLKKGKWRITSSSARQESGSIVPNFVRPAGIVRTTRTKRHHTWRGTYVYGSRVPTPWGGIEVYRKTAISRWDLRANGRARAVWLDLA